MGPPPKRRGENWFTGIYTTHYAPVVRYGLRRLGDHDDSIELAQEVFVVAWRRRDQVPDHSLPWLYGVARRLLANRYRAVRARPAQVPLMCHEHGNDQHAAENAIVEVASVADALARLPEGDQEILRLVGWEELSLGEVAVALGCTRTAATVRLHRARRRLNVAMTKPTFAPAPRIPRPAGINR